MNQFYNWLTSNITFICGWITAILIIIGFIPYITSIFKNRFVDYHGKPEKITWLIWACNDSILLAAMFLTKSLNAQITISCLCAWTIVGLAMLFGKKGWQIIDLICGIGAGIGLVLWAIFDDPTYSVIASSSVLVVGGIPTFISTYKDPRSENRFSWTVWFISCFFTFAAIPIWTVDSMTQPISFFVIELIMVVLLWLLPWFRKLNDQTGW